MEGILLVDKPLGPTSQRVVQKIKTRLKLKRAGHTGTLDPLATGILPVALGEGTKLIPFLEESRKIYQVTARLGVVTASYDADGEVLETRDISGVTPERIREHVNKFCGEILQIPPAFSAVKVAGRPLYRYARKQQVVAVPPRRVRIDRIEFLGWDPPHLELQVHCSRGTYIRTLVHDLGGELGCGAMVSQLRRLQSGPFSLDGALSLEQLLAGVPVGPASLVSPLQALGHLPSLEIFDPGEMKRIGQGVPLYCLRERLSEARHREGRILLKGAGRALAVLRLEKSGEFRFLRVFS